MRNLNALYVGADADLKALVERDVLGFVVEGEEAGIDGWEREVSMLMAHRGEPPEPDPRVSPVGRDGILDLRREWVQAELVAPVVEQILAGDRRLLERTPTEMLTIGGAAMALRVGDGAVQMVEDVYTTPARRRRGLGSALVRTAVANAYAAGAELVFLPTDVGGDAARLYASLGFEELCRMTGLWRVSD